VVILVDSSAWVEFLRATDSPLHHRVRDLLTDGAHVVTTEVVVMELLAGPGDERIVPRIRRLLQQYELVPLEGMSDFEDAAAIFRTCRRHGETVRKRIDCIIAAVAIRVDAEVLHRDRDFEAIARHTPLRLAG
jgi:predicted nucleic acid-binding protein